jgi:hypothetical protein
LSITNAKTQEEKTPQALKVVPPPSNAERLKELSQSGASEPKGAAPTGRALAPATPQKAPSGSEATNKASWHRSRAWTEESVVAQLEKNTLLLPVRTMLRGSYKAVEGVSPIDPLIPIVILRVEDHSRNEIVGKLQPLVTPALPINSGQATRLIFLDKDELEQVLGNSIKPESLFWVAPAKKDSASGQRILILNEN